MLLDMIVMEHTDRPKAHLCSHGSNALGADGAAQHVAAQVRVLLVFQVRDAAPQPSLILHVSGFKLFVDA